MPPEMTELKKQQMEAIKLLSDWSKWMVTIETGGIGGIGALIGIKFPNINTHSRFGQCNFSWDYLFTVLSTATLLITILCFLYSIIYACKLLFDLPGITEKLISIRHTTIYDMKDPGFEGPTIFIYAKKQYLSFCAGMTSVVITFAIWIIKSLF